MDAYARSAICGARSLICKSSVSRSFRSRSRSLAGNVGRSATSAKSAIALSSTATGAWSTTVDWSHPLPVPICTPRKASWSAMSREVRRPAPSSSIDAVSVATPALLAGSPSPPVFTTRIMSTRGSSWCSTTRISSPLSSWRRVTGGSVSRPRPGSSGGFERSNVGVRGVSTAATTGGVTGAGTGSGVGACAHARASIPAAAPVRHLRNPDIAHLLHHEFDLAFGHHCQHDLGLAQIVARDPLHIGGGDRDIAGRILTDVVRCSREIVVEVQLVCLPVHTRELIEELCAIGILRPRELALGDPPRAHLSNLFVDELCHAGRRLPRFRGYRHAEHPVEPAADLKRTHVLRDLHLVDETLVQARILVPRQHVREKVERRVIGMKRFRGRPRIVQTRKLDLVFEHQERVLRDRHLARSWPRGHRRPAWNLAEVALDPDLHGVAVEVAGDRERRIVRRVVRPEELLDVLERCRRQIGH